jgi:sugar lactone lactonase YvrE
MTERQGRLYTVCTDNVLNPLATKRLFVLNLADPAGELEEMFNPSDVVLPNGLATLPDGSLLLADSGAPLLPGKLLRFTVNAHGAVDGQSVYYRYVLNKPNGLKVDGQRLYVSLNPLAYAGLSQLRRYTLGAAGPQDGVVLFSSWWFLDDFTLSSDGVVVAEFLGNRVMHVSESGQLLREARVTQPTSVQLWRGVGVPAGDVTVTERGSGRLLQLPGFGAWLR